MRRAFSSRLATLALVLAAAGCDGADRRRGAEAHPARKLLEGRLPPLTEAEWARLEPSLDQLQAKVVRHHEFIAALAAARPAFEVPSKLEGFEGRGPVAELATYPTSGRRQRDWAPCASVPQPRPRSRLNVADDPIVRWEQSRVRAELQIEEMMRQLRAILPPRDLNSSVADLVSCAARGAEVHVLALTLGEDRTVAGVPGLSSLPIAGRVSGRGADIDDFFEQLVRQPRLVVLDRACVWSEPESGVLLEVEWDGRTFLYDEG